MVHLKPLPGSPDYDVTAGMDYIVEKAIEDTRNLVSGGVDGIQIENQWDRPFQKPEQIGMETVAAVSAAVVQVKRESAVPLGVNIHLNGVCHSIAVALAAGCDWIRAFELANAYISSAGFIEAAGPEALRFRKMIGAEEVMIFGDFHVKHGSHEITSDRSLEEQAEDVETAKADGIIITGLKTGNAPSLADIGRIRNVVQIPLLIGSGFSAENAGELLPALDGAIVGSSLKVDGKLENPIDLERVKIFMDRIRAIRG